MGAKAATEAIKETFPDHYLYDPTPLPEVLWRVSTECVAVEERDNKGLCSGRRCPEAARRRLSTTRWLRDSTLLKTGRGGREREKERALCIEESTNTWGNLVAVADMCDHSY